MRILITSNHLARPGGTETWVTTMVDAFTEMNLNVNVWAPVKGRFADHFLDGIWGDPRETYDLALINHNSTIKYVKAKRKIFTSHGVFSELDIPPDETEVDRIVAVSEEVAFTHRIRHIIRNPINTSVFSFLDKRDRDDFSPLILFVTGSKNKDYLAGICERYGYSSCFVGRDFDYYRMSVYHYISDICVSVGRGALEAMSCGNPVVIWDDRPYYSAPVSYTHPSDLTLLMQSNYSGRNAVKIGASNEFDLKNLKSWFDKSHGEQIRKHVETHHDHIVIAKSYLQLSGL